MLALLGAGLALRAPALVPALLALCDPFALTRYAGHTTVTTFKASLAGALAGLALRRAPLVPRTAPGRAIALVLALLVVATAATIPTAAFRPPAVRETLKAFEELLCFAVAWACARERGAVRALGAACALAVALVALDALRDYAAPQSGIWIGGHAFTRLAGHLEGPNQFAAWLGIALPAAIAGEPLWPLVAAATALGGAALALTLSRAGIAQALVAVAGAAWARGVAVRRTLAVALVALVAAGGGFALATRSSGAVAHVASTAESVDPGGTGSRRELWSAALRMAAHRPLLGVGAGGFEFALPRYGVAPRVRTHANSLYLEALADGGVVLLLATLAAAIVPPLALLRARRPFALAAGIAGAALALHGIVDDVTFYPKVAQLWWIVAGVAAGSGIAGSRSAPGTR